MQVHCLHDELKSIKELKPHPKNRNQHPEDQIKRLAKILKYQGWRYPIKISSRSGFITSGHGRLEAARLNKWDKVPVNYQDYESDEQEYADVQSDNAIASWAELDLSGINADIGDLGPDFDIEMLGLKDFIVEPADKLALCDEDEVPDPKESIAKRGDIWLLGAHRLMCGDSTSIDDVEKLMDGQKADMVFTDPPYGVNEETRRKDKKRFGAAKSQNFSKVIGDDSEDVAKEAFQTALAFSDSVIYWGANNYSFMPISRGWIVWDKRENKGTDDNGDAELAWTSFDKPIRAFYHLWKGMIKGSEHGQGRVHPTQKPIALAEWCFENYNNPKIILDLFGGSGSTLIACEKTNRKCFMMEIDTHYCDVIIARWEKYTGQKASLSAGTIEGVDATQATA